VDDGLVWLGLVLSVVDEEFSGFFPPNMPSNPSQETRDIAITNINIQINNFFILTS
jgi:hypothetical protein